MSGDGFGFDDFPEPERTGRKFRKPPTAERTFSTEELDALREKNQAKVVSMDVTRREVKFKYEMSEAVKIYRDRLIRLGKDAKDLGRFIQGLVENGVTEKDLIDRLIEIGKLYEPDFEGIQRRFSQGMQAQKTTWQTECLEPTKGQKMARTMYDSHLDKSNVATPIFMLEDSHLENIIRVKVSNFVKFRTKYSESPRSEDPMIAALGKVEVWNPEKLALATKTALEDLHPYLAEALVRGNQSIINQAVESMQLLAKRSSRFEMPAEMRMIDAEEDPDEVQLTQESF